MMVSKETKQKYCQFCGNNLGIVIASDKYIISLKNHISRLENIISNQTFSKELSVMDVEKIITSDIKYYRKDKATQAIKNI